MSLGVRRGDQLISRSNYQARGFVLAAGETVPEDATAFDKAAHARRLVPVSKGEAYVALTKDQDGEVYVHIAREGQEYACILLADSFEPRPAG